MSADVKTSAGEVADAHREASMARIAMSQMERQRNEARKQVIALLNALERLDPNTKALFPEPARKAVRKAQQYAEAWKADQ